jgi:hypothetical protein
MRSKLFDDKAETVKITSERWVRILPDKGSGYHLFDPLQEEDLGRILFDNADNWIYDGQLLTITEQEEVAGLITGHQQEMEELIRSIAWSN